MSPRSRRRYWKKDSSGTGAASLVEAGFQPNRRHRFKKKKKIGDIEILGGSSFQHQGWVKMVDL